MKRTIAVIAGGDSAEFEISLQTANHIFESLDREKYIPYLIKIIQLIEMILASLEMVKKSNLILLI